MKSFKKLYLSKPEAPPTISLYKMGRLNLKSPLFHIWELTAPKIQSTTPKRNIPNKYFNFVTFKQDENFANSRSTP